MNIPQNVIINQTIISNNPNNIIQHFYSNTIKNIYLLVFKINWETGFWFKNTLTFACLLKKILIIKMFSIIYLVIMNLINLMMLP